jgi:Ca2+/Na+ antiporter
MLGMGAPLIANYQSALFYPPTWIYFLLYSIGDKALMAWGQAVMVVLHLSWAALGMALLIRQLRMGKLAQIVAGLAFGLSGYLVARAGFLSINAAIAWMPWVILGVTRLIEEYHLQHDSYASAQKAKNRSRRITIISAYLLLLLSIAMQLLAGHAQITWYTFILAAFWTLYLLVFNYKFDKRSEHDGNTSLESNRIEVESEDYLPDDKGDEKTKTWRPTFFILVLVGSALLFAIGLAAVQLFPTAEYLLESQRSAAVDYDFAMNYSFWPWRLLSFIAPGLYGSPVSGDYWGFANYWEDAVYLGLIPFIMAVYAVMTRGKRTRNNRFINPSFIAFLVAIIVIVFVLALGRNTPVYPWLYANVPTFDMFQAPTRISILAVFSLAILAAIGIESWRRSGERGLYWLRLGVMAAVAIAIGAGAASLVSRSISWDIRPSFIRSTALLGFWAVGFGVLALKAPAKEESGTDPEKWNWWHWAVVLWVAADLIVAGWGLNPSVDVRMYSDPSPSAKVVKNMLNGGRLYLPPEDEEIIKFEHLLRFDTFEPFDEGQGWENLRAALLPNVTILDGIPSVNNFDPLLPGRYVSWIELLQVGSAEVESEMLNLMGVEVVESIDSDERYGVRFDSTVAYPRFRGVACGVPVESESEAIGLIEQGEIDFKQQVILEIDNPSVSTVCGEGAHVDIEVKSDNPNQSVLVVNSPSPGYLVMSDVWYPGWQAFTNGESTPIFRANYLFRAVAFPAGENEVRIDYRPTEFYVGILITALTLIGLLILGLYWFGKKRDQNRFELI